MAHIDWNSTLYDQKHAFVFEYGKSLLSVLAPQAGETILDLGCGTGHLAADIAQSGAHVIGIDGSPKMIEAAKTAYPHLEFQVADARTFSFPNTFDAIFSNATLHWIREAENVIQNITTSLKPGGRLVVEMGGKGNVAAVLAATRRSIQEIVQQDVDDGWYFPSIGEYTPLLERHGIQVQSAILFDRPTRLEGPDGLRNWLRMFGAQMLRNVPETQQAAVFTHVEDSLRDQFFKGDHWIADYRRLRLTAIREVHN